MRKQLHMIGGDARTAYAVARLSEWGWKCESYHVPGLADTYEPAKTAVHNWVLPYPAIRNGKIAGTTDEIDDFLLWLQPGNRVIGGAMGKFSERMLAAGATVQDIATDETLLMSNAVATAECAIALAAEMLPCTLYKTECLVVGYGRIGKSLARILQAMHADVTVSARKPRDLAAIAANGFKSEVTGAWQMPLSRYRCIFNTVPHPVFTTAQIDILGKACIFLDLASAPYGIAAADVPLLSGRYHLASGLPGRMSPESAGLYYAQALRRQLEQEAS